MKEKETYDFLDELIASDYKQIEEISRRYPVLDKSSKKRIAELCEEKLNMKSEDNKKRNTTDNESVSDLEVYKKPRWYKHPAFAIAASLVLVVGLVGVTVAGLSRSNDKDPMSKIENVPPIVEEKSDKMEWLSDHSGELIEAFNTIEKMYGGNISKDDNQKYTHNGLEYVKVTDEMFTETWDVDAFMDVFFTQRFISERYPDMFETKHCWLIDVDKELYIKSSARGAGYTFTGKPEIIADSEDENSAKLRIAYDNYGQTDLMIIHLKYEDEKWLIDGFDSIETAIVTAEAATSAAGEDTTAAPVEESTSPVVQTPTEPQATQAPEEYPTNAGSSNPGAMEITPEMAYGFINALDFIDQLGGNGAAVDYDYDDYYDDHNGEQRIRVTEPGFTCVADVRNYMRAYLTDSFIAERYYNLLDSESPMLVEITTSTDPVPRLYSKNTPKGCGFQWTTRELTIEKQTDDMYTILAEYDNYGGLETMAIIVIRDTDGSWKINNVTFGL